MNDPIVLFGVIALIFTVAFLGTVIVMLIVFAIWEWWSDRKNFSRKKTDWDDPE